MVNDPHVGQVVLAAGTPLAEAKAAMIMIHGRGANAQSILGLAGEFEAEGFAYLAPQAATGTWYPQRFLVETRLNEPWLSSALGAVDALVQQVIAAGIPAEKLILLGFSQGACLTLEYAARHGKRYGGLVGLSGGLIGADGEPRKDSGSLAGTPVFMGCSDVDPHVPVARLTSTESILKGLGGKVTLKIYMGMGHTVNTDEVEAVNTLMRQVVG